MLLHINPTRQQGKHTGSLARASGWYMTFFAAGVIVLGEPFNKAQITLFKAIKIPGAPISIVTQVSVGMSLFVGEDDNGQVRDCDVQLICDEPNHLPVTLDSRDPLFPGSVRPRITVNVPSKSVPTGTEDGSSQSDPGNRPK